MIVQIAMMCLVCLWHTTVFLVYDNHSQNLAVGCDRVGFGVLLGLYVLFQFTFFLNAVYLVSDDDDDDDDDVSFVDTITITFI